MHGQSGKGQCRHMQDDGECHKYVGAHRRLMPDAVAPQVQGSRQIRKLSCTEREEGSAQEADAMRQ